MFLVIALLFVLVQDSSGCPKPVSKRCPGESWTYTTPGIFPNIPSVCFKAIAFENPADANISYHDAKEMCKSQFNASLAPIRNTAESSAAEGNFVKVECAAKTSAIAAVKPAPLDNWLAGFYFGLVDTSGGWDFDTTYQWDIDGSVLKDDDYSNWFTSQPTREDYYDPDLFEACLMAMVKYEMKWNDVNCDQGHRYIAGTNCAVNAVI